MMINAKKTLDADDDEALTLQQFNYFKKSFFQLTFIYRCVNLKFPPFESKLMGCTFVYYCNINTINLHQELF